MDIGIIIFLLSQAVVIVAFLVGTYVKTAVRLKEIEIHVSHCEETSESNHNAIGALQNEAQMIRLKLEHMETMQAMLCSTCPLKMQHTIPDK